MIRGAGDIQSPALKYKKGVRMIELAYDPPKAPESTFPRIFRRHNLSIPVPPGADAVNRVRARLSKNGEISLELQEDLSDFLMGKPGTDRVIRTLVAHECAKESIVFTPAPRTLSDVIAVFKALTRLR
jgi:hypothetical protein